MHPDADVMGAMAAAPATTSIAIVPSKLHPPHGPSDEVHRARLDELLDQGRQVVIVTAPAGYGKSTLVAGWLRRRPDRRAAWVSLDPFDRSPLSFWRHLTAALTGLVPRLVEADAILLERGGPEPEFLAALIHGILDDRIRDDGIRDDSIRDDGIRDDSGPLVLVLDDLHHVESDPIREGLTTLVERCDGALHLITLSRSDPPLPTSRWLAEGRAVVLRSDSLAFRPDEAARLMERFHLDALDRGELDRLTVHVEGWAVGLLLSGLTLEGRPDLALSLDDLLGSDRHLTDYLVTEVLARLPEELRQLALVLSVPPWFDDELASRLTGRSDAAALVDRLVRSNPFVVAIPSPAGHRFHHLLRSLLSATFRSSDPAGFAATHRATAATLAERGYTTDALASLLTVGAIDEAFDLVTAPILQTNDQGRVRELAQWLEMLGEVRATDRVRALDVATAQLIAGRISEALAWTERASELPGTDDPSTATLHALVRTTTLGAAGLVDEALDDLPVLETAGGDTTGSDRIDSRLSAQVVRLVLEVGDLERAERWLPLVERNPEASVASILAPALRSWALLERGSASEALTLATSACAAESRLGIRNYVAYFDALLSRGRAELLMLRLDELGSTLEELAEVAEIADYPFFMLRLWPLRLAERALSEGWPAALELTTTWHPEAYPRRGGRLAARHTELRALALANCGLVEEAEPLVRVLPAGRRRTLLEARLHLLTGTGDDVERCVAGHPVWVAPDRLEALLLLAQSTQGEAARAAMTSALELGRTSGIIAPFVLEGRRLEQLLDDLPIDQLCPELGAWRRARSAERRRSRTVDIVEPLTPKELAVLQRLPTHATYRAIGAQLYVSVNTVKTYVSSLYRKLGVSSRAEAVEVARRCGLLDG